MSLRVLLVAIILSVASHAAGTTADNDADGIDDASDNCLLIANATQRDTDGDNIGNACDSDVDNSCTVNFADLSIYAANFLLSGDLDTDNNGDGITNFGDIAQFANQFLQSPGPSGLYSACNVESELPATASSNSEFQSASLAVDNNMSSRWETVHGVDPGILLLDLGQSYPLTRVEIHWEAANAQTYLIEGSNDNFSWDVLATFNGGQFGDRTDINNINGTYRYVRMNGLARSVGNVYGYSIWEMDVFGDANAPVEFDLDADDDGVTNAQDLCPDTPPGSMVDSFGCVITVSVNEVTSAGGLLVGGAGSDNPGFTLYVFDNDTGNISNCNDACAIAWPPVLVSDDVASGVDELSTITRNDGSLQAAYQGRPLYFYDADQNAGDTNGQGVGGVWWVVEYNTLYEPLYNDLTVLEPAVQEDTPSALITRFADRARDRHAREDEFQAYDHYLSFYWEHRTAAVEIIDPIGKGGDTITFNVTTQWPLNPTQAELRFFYRGINTVAEYHNNGIMSSIDSTHYTRSVNFNSKTNAPLQVGDRMEFELSQFLLGTPNGRDNYYGTTFLYIVGEGLVPWEARGVFGDPATEREDSYPIAQQGLSGGKGTLGYQYSDEPDNHFLQMPTNLSNINGQVFVEGRRVHHTDFGDGSHNEAPENAPFIELAGLLGNRYVNRSCVACHVRNGRALPPAVNQNLNQYVVQVSDVNGNPDAMTGSLFQPLSTQGSGEGTVRIGSWSESGGLRSPNFVFTGSVPSNYSARIAPQLVGLGLLEAINESDIENLADPDDLDSDGISGRMRLVSDPQTSQTRLGRFGWKASQASVKHQVAAALNSDIGVMTSVRPVPDCGVAQSDCSPPGSELDDEYLNKLSAYVSLLGVGARRNLDDPVTLQGEGLFNSAGCNACHSDTFQTSVFHPHAELRDQTIHPYTDLLLHDMGPGLADTLVDADVASSEWRTPPLWGIGLTAGVSGGEAYLHDGRARTLQEAILWHGGEAETVKQAFVAMSAADQNALIAFLQSL